MRRLVWFTLGFAAACFVGTYLAPGLWALLGAACAGFLAGGLAVRRYRGNVAAVAALCSLGLAVGLCGFAFMTASFCSRPRGGGGNPSPGGSDFGVPGGNGFRVFGGRCCLVERSGVPDPAVFSGNRGGSGAGRPDSGNGAATPDHPRRQPGTHLSPVCRNFSPGLCPGFCDAAGRRA